MPRSTFYHQPTAQNDTDLRQALCALSEEHPTYGYRRLTVLLQRAGWSVNRKRIQRLMAEMGLPRPVKRRTTRTTNSAHEFPRYPNLVCDLPAMYPDHIWVADIT